MSYRRSQGIGVFLFFVMALALFFYLRRSQTTSLRSSLASRSALRLTRPVGLPQQVIDTFDTYLSCHNEDSEASLEKYLDCTGSPSRPAVAIKSSRRKWLGAGSRAWQTMHTLLDMAWLPPPPPAAVPKLEASAAARSTVPSQGVVLCDASSVCVICFEEYISQRDWIRIVPCHARHRCELLLPDLEACSLSDS